MVRMGYYVGENGAFVPPYTGNDDPGTGDNILADGESRIWTQPSSGKTYHVTNAGGTYKLVELTAT